MASMESTQLAANIACAQTKIAQQGLLRQRRASSSVHACHADMRDSGSRFTCEGKTYLNFSSNDYLGLSRVPALADALYRGAQRYGIGSTSSPLVTGYSEAHVALEQHLCAHTGHEAALLFVSGFSANSALMKTLFTSQHVVLADKLVHASIIDGIRASGAQFKRFLHNQVDSAARLLQHYDACALVTESVFSMEGDYAPLAALSDLCRQQGSWLIVDDAHGFGVCNPLAPALFADYVDVQVVTFGKALGCQGAAILGSQALIDFLVCQAREYIYSTALSPASACVALAASQYAIAHPELQAKLQANIQLFKTLCQQAQIPLLANADSAIQAVIVGDTLRTLALAEQLRAAGLWISAIRPPTVPKSTARLRITLTASHSEADIRCCIAQLAQALTTVTESGKAVLVDINHAEVTEMLKRDV